MNILFIKSTTGAVWVWKYIDSIFFSSVAFFHLYSSLGRILISVHIHVFIRFPTILLS